MRQPLTGYFLGRRPYGAVFTLMQELFEARRSDAIGDTVLLLEHEKVVTRGRGAHAENLLTSRETLKGLGIDVVDTGRGGDVTLHAPGQLVVYPIIKLSPDRQDVRKYVQALTSTMKSLISSYGLDGGNMEGLIGLWIDSQSPESWPGQALAKQPQKIGAIGVRISRWITSHGFALNLTTDLSDFQWIIPCGIKEYGVATVKSLTGQSPEVAATAPLALRELNQRFGQDEALYHDLSSENLSSLLTLTTKTP